MKLPMPGFLRKRLRSSSNAPSRSSSTSCSQKSSSHLQSTTSTDSNAPGSCSAACTSLASSCIVSPSGEGWIKVIQAPQVSSMDEIVVLQETTGKIERQFTPKLPSFDLHRELEEAFLRFDANHDGKISTVELGSVLRSLGEDPSDEELVLMVKEVDRDGDGFIDLQEFILLNSVASSTARTEDLREAFLVFDADDDGKISVEELYNVLSRLGESCTMEECGRMIRGVDTDGDGYVDFAEFCTMMAIQ